MAIVLDRKLLRLPIKPRSARHRLPMPVGEEARAAEFPTDAEDLRRCAHLAGCDLSESADAIPQGGSIRTLQW